MYAKADIYTTARNTEKRIANDQQVDIATSVSGDADITVHTDAERQEILGFGGAFTEAMANALSRVSSVNRRKALDALFDMTNGNRYSFCRTHINSCDFSTQNYSYCDTPGDTRLETFDVSHDEGTLIPLITEAEEIRGEPLRLFASPWSPPAWMKTTGRMNRGGSLRREYYELWAQYFVKYIQAYAERGVRIWGVTPQNEPLAITPWDNCVYTHAEERELVRCLGRAFKEHGLAQVKIIVWDHNKDCMQERLDTLFSDLEVYDYTWGVGFHWYGPMDTESTVDDSVLDYTHKSYPGKPLVFTEGCNPVPAGASLDSMLGAWWTGEKYARHIIADLNHYTCAWTDWNMVLDEQGGPNHVGNYCHAPIIADTVNDRLLFEPPYYYLGHFSRFIDAGAVCLETQCGARDRQCAAVRNPDGKIALVVLNESEEARATSVAINGNDAFSLETPAHSIQTAVIS